MLSVSTMAHTYAVNHWMNVTHVTQILILPRMDADFVG